MRSNLPSELSFINEYWATENALEYASWRISPFDAPVWECLFGKSSTVIDFRKVLDDGTLLTDFNNHVLLQSIKRFICMQTSVSLTGGVVLAPFTARIRVGMALQVIDYFLLRSDEFQVARNGFSKVTSNDVLGLIHAVTSEASIKSAIYEPERRILEHLRSVKVSNEDFERIRKTHPSFFEIYPEETFALSVDQTLVARAWLKINGYYSYGLSGSDVEYRCRVARSRLLSKIIGHKVLSLLKFDGLELPGLDISPFRSFFQELPAVPVANLDDDERASFEVANSYLSTLRSMNVARAHGVMLVPEHVLPVIDDAELLLQERTKGRTRYTTLPFALANGLLSKSIAFYIEYGEELVDYYLALAKDKGDVRELPLPVPDKLAKLGVRRWRSCARISTEFFAELRRGECLYNMLEVLLGSIAVLVNTLMARRIAELEGLRAKNIVEENGMYFLAFDLRKANILEQRARVLRPMPIIVADALKLLAKLSRGLQNLGYPNDGRLFEVPRSVWSGAPYYGTGLPNINRCLDRFCDFHEVEQDEKGRRYYVRAHQLRRNFALLFFWHGSFGGVGVLSYFLGHSKPSETYRYVTESISGKVLRRVKATVAKDLIRSDHPATAALAQLVCERYALTLNDLHILPERDIVDYVEGLMASGEAEVEPEFCNGPNGEEYRVLYRVRQKNQGDT